MRKSTAKTVAKELLRKAGIAINGPNPWDFEVKDERVFARVLSQGTFGLGESYMDGWWEARQLDEFFFKVLTAGLKKEVSKNWILASRLIASRLFNLQSRRRAFQVGQEHYDLGNDLYENMLDKRMTYTCGYWKNAKNLDEAQVAKLDLTCRKLALRPGQRVLDIGCGWGSFAKFAAEKYGVQVVGITVSREQMDLGRKLCKGLPIEIRLEDYRNVRGEFDHIVSLGMFEHVGYKNFRDYFSVANRNLRNDGLFLLHTIGRNESATMVEPWIGKYIFPNGLLPSIKQIGKAVEGLFVMEDLHNFGLDYDRTLMAWFSNFDRHWEKLKKNYSERFYRMWKYYLLSCAGVFRAREAQVWQIVLSKKQRLEKYEGVR